MNERPVIRRRRLKQTLDLDQRLKAHAEEARDKASQLPEGAERDRLLRAATESETAVQMNGFVSTKKVR